MDHDHSYKLLFAHPKMMRDLLEAFVGGEWVSDVDFNTLERVSGDYIADDLQGRADDIVWRVRCGEHMVYLLVEFLCGAPHKNSYAESSVMRSEITQSYRQIVVGSVLETVRRRIRLRITRRYSWPLEGDRSPRRRHVERSISQCRGSVVAEVGFGRIGD